MGDEVNHRCASCFVPEEIGHYTWCINFTGPNSTRKEHYPQSNLVDSPNHYNSGSLECIDAIEASMSRDEFLGYLKGNTMKYLWRYRYKGKPEEDLKKAKWYLEQLTKTYTNGDSTNGP